MLLECIAVFEDLQAIGAEQMPSVFMDHPKMDIHLRVERGAILTHLTNIRHLSRLMSVLHMLEKQWLTFKCPLTDLALGRRFIGTMNIFQVALELEGSGELAVTVLADGVTIHLAILLVEFNVVLHMVHESNVVFEPFGTMRASERRGNLRKVCELGYFAPIPSIIKVIYQHNKLGLDSITSILIWLWYFGRR